MRHAEPGGKCRGTLLKGLTRVLGGRVLRGCLGTWLAPLFHGPSPSPNASNARVLLLLLPVSECAILVSGKATIQRADGPRTFDPWAGGRVPIHPSGHGRASAKTIGGAVVHRARIARRGVAMGSAYWNLHPRGHQFCWPSPSLKASNPCVLLLVQPGLRADASLLHPVKRAPRQMPNVGSSPAPHIENQIT